MSRMTTTAGQLLVIIFVVSHLGTGAEAAGGRAGGIVARGRAGGVAGRGGAGSAGGRSRTTIQSPSERCHATLRRLVEHRARLMSQASNISGSLESSIICPDLSADIDTCCIEGFQNKQKYTANKQGLPQKIQLLNVEFKNTLVEHHQQYMVYINRTINLAKNHTLDALNNHRIISEDAQEAVDLLFSNLTNFHLFNTTDASLEQTVSEFFDKLFPALLLTQINATSQRENSNKNNCLLNVRSKVLPHPFGIAPASLLVQLQKFVFSSALYSTALGVSIEMIDRLDEAGFYSADCMNGPQSFCSLCKGLMEVKLCRSVCFENAQGCLNHVMTLDPLWSTFVDVLGLFVSTDKLSRALDVLQDIDTRVTDGIAHFKASFNLFLPQVILECGEMTNASNASSSVTPSVPSSQPQEKTLLHHSLNVLFYSEQKMFMSYLTDTKDFLRRFPDNLCSVESHSTVEQEICWDGNRLSRHNKDVSGFHGQSQRKMLSHTMSNASEYEQIATKLRFITEVLMNSITVDSASEFKQNNKVQVISNQRLRRSYSSVDNDDEDMESGSSGSGSNEYRSSGMYSPETSATTTKVVDPIVELTTLPNSSQGTHPLTQPDPLRGTASTRNGEHCTTLMTLLIAPICINLMTTLIIPLW